MSRLGHELAQSCQLVNYPEIEAVPAWIQTCDFVLAFDKSYAGALSRLSTTPQLTFLSSTATDPMGRLLQRRKKNSSHTTG